MLASVLKGSSHVWMLELHAHWHLFLIVVFFVEIFVYVVALFHFISRIHSPEPLPLILFLLHILIILIPISTVHTLTILPTFLPHSITTTIFLQTMRLFTATCSNLPFIWLIFYFIFGLLTILDIFIGVFLVHLLF